MTGFDYGTLEILGRQLDDIEKLRIATGNRVGAIHRTYGEVALSAFPALAMMHDALFGMEEAAAKEMVQYWRTHRLARIIRDDACYKGVGEKSIARLVSMIGDPADRPNVAKLWAYCGVGRPGRIPKGASQAEVFAHGNPLAKKQVWLITTSMLKAGNRTVYDARKEATEGKLHEAACPPCHAKPGDPWRDGHRHADALRVSGKAFLRDVWVDARDSLIEVTT